MTRLAEVIHSRNFFLNISKENYSNYLKLLIVKCIVFIIIIECKCRLLLFRYSSFFLPTSGKQNLSSLGILLTKGYVIAQ